MRNIEASSEAEGAPGVVETVGVGEAYVAARRAVLGVARLHPQDVFGDARLGSDGETAHAAADPREGGRVDPNPAKGCEHHAGDESRRRRRASMDHPRAVRGFGELREEGGEQVRHCLPRRDSPAGRSGCAGGCRSWAELIVEIEIQVSRLA